MPTPSASICHFCFWWRTLLGRIPLDLMTTGFVLTILVRTLEPTSLESPGLLVLSSPPPVGWHQIQTLAASDSLKLSPAANEGRNLSVGIIVHVLTVHVWSGLTCNCHRPPVGLPLFVGEDIAQLACRCWR